MIQGLRQALRHHLRERRRRWIRHRQGTDQGTVTLTGRRIYILPTRTGIIFAAVLFTMLLGALNYSNNMGFALVFLLAAVAIVSIHHCQRNLAGLQITVTGGPPVFAGDSLACVVRLTNTGKQPYWQLAAGPDGDDTPTVDLAPGASAELHLRLPTVRRGPVPCPEIRLSTLYPLGLFRAWTWLHPDLEMLAYPRPADRAALPGLVDAGTGDGGGSARGSDDFAGLRTFIPGESLSRVAWKTLARTGEFLAKDYRSGSPVTVLDWHRLPGLAPEERLSLLTRMLLDARARGQPFGLRLPGQEYAPASGHEHTERCLRALALFPAGEPAHG